MNNQTSFESYLKLKNDKNNEEISERASIAYFILNLKERSFTYKKNKEFPQILAKHASNEILGFEQTVDTNDKGICDYPIGFQIKTSVRTYVLYANSRLIYNRWMDSLKTFFKGSNTNNRGNYTPEVSPEKGKGHYLNPSFKQADKSPINTKTKLTATNNNPNYNSNNFNSGTNNIGFDEDLINVLNDIEENDNKGKKNSLKKLSPFENSVNSFEKGLKSQNSNQESSKKQNMEEIEQNYNGVFTVSNNVQATVLTELNQEWDKDFKEISFLAIDKGNTRPSNKKSVELKNDLNRISGKQEQKVEIQSKNNAENNNMRYKSNVLLFDDPSLHIRQAVNEGYVVENLHCGMDDDNLNKSIDYKKDNNNSFLMKKNTKKGKNEGKILEKSVDGINPNVSKKIIENNDNSWTFSITVPVPVKNEK